MVKLTENYPIEYSYIVTSKIEKSLNTNVITNSMGKTQQVVSDKTIFIATSYVDTLPNYTDEVLNTLLSTLNTKLTSNGGGIIALKNLAYDNSLTLASNVSIMTFNQGVVTTYPLAAEPTPSQTFSLGEVAPTEDGNEGDLYIDTVTGDFYQFTSGAWVKKVTFSFVTPPE